MVELDRYVLEFVAPLHLTSRGIGLEETDLVVRSDTVFSALCVGLAATRGAGAVSDLIEWYASGLAPFVVSSAFPWAGELFLYPRPRLVASGASRARWVSQRVLETMLAGGASHVGDDHVFAGGSIWIADEDRRLAIPPLPWWIATEVPRVTVDRQTQTSALYRCGRTLFAPESGLYILVQWRSSEWRQTFEEVLVYLQDAGLGGERSAGHGQFQVRARETIQIADAPDGSFVFTLGLCRPSSAEIRDGLLDGAAFDLETRGGWVAGVADRAVWRRSVRMLAEGALLHRVSDTLGELVDVTPAGFHAHPVYRFGMALALGCVPPPQLAVAAIAADPRAG